jgi:hypothetical protein
MLKVAAVVQQVMRELCKAVSEKDKVMVITKIILNETRWLLEYIGCSKSLHLMQMAFGGSAVSSANSCKT